MDKIKLTIVISMIFAISCKNNKVCREEIFGDQVWHGHWGGFEDIYFRPDDTLEWKTYAAQTWSTKDTYNFDNDCGGFTWHAAPPTNSNFHWTITIINSDSVKLKKDIGAYEIIIHK